MVGHGLQRFTPPDLCRAMILGTGAELVRCGQTLPSELKSRLEKGCGLYNLQAEQVYLESDPEGELLDEHDAMKRFADESGPEFWDEISDKSLPPNLVKTARREEL